MSGISLYARYLCLNLLQICYTLKHILNYYFYNSIKEVKRFSYQNAILTSIGLTVMSCLEMHY